MTGRRTLHVLAGLVLGTQLAACTATDSDPAGDRAASPNAPATTSPTTTAAPTTGSLDEPVLVRLRERPGLAPRWDTAVRWSRNDPDVGFGLSTGSLTATYTEWPSEGSVRVVDRFERELLIEPFKRGFQVQDIWLDGHYFVIEWINTRKRIVTMSAWHVGLDGMTAVDLTGLNAKELSPELALDGDQLMWTAGQPQRGMCLGLTDLATGRSRTVECVEKGIILGDPALDDDTLVYSELTGPYRPAKRCKWIQVVDHHGRHDTATEQAIDAMAPCDAWSAVPLPDGIAWDVADPNDGHISFAEGYALSDGETYDLDQLDTDSFVSCGGSLFWTDAVDEASTPIRWEPGEHTSTVALDLDEDKDQSATTPSCADDRYLVTRVDDLDGRDEHLRLLVLDTRRH